MWLQSPVVWMFALAAVALGVRFFLNGADAPPSATGAATASVGRASAHAALPTAGTPTAPRDHGTQQPHAAAGRRPEPLPPPRTPLTQIYDALKARAAAGDATAASRLFNDVRECAVARRMKRTLPSWMQTSIHLKDDGNGTSHAQVVPAYIMRMTSDQYDYVQSLKPMCDGLDDNRIDEVFSLEMLAARLGDMHALACFVGSNLDYMPGLVNHPQWLEQFKDNAMNLADYGIRQGNWDVIHALQIAYAGKGAAFLLTQVTGFDPVRNATYLELERLGAANAKEAADIGQQLNLVAEQMLPDQLLSAQSAAQDLYSRYIANTPKDNSAGLFPYCWGH